MSMKEQDHQKEFFEEMGAPYIEALLKKIGKDKSRHVILACLLLLLWYRVSAVSIKELKPLF